MLPPSEDAFSRDAKTRWIGALTLSCWLFHIVDLVRLDDAHNVLWLCNLAGGVITLGCWMPKPSRSLIAIGTLWLAYGTPLFVLDAAMGGTYLLSSWFSHIGCLIAGIVAVRLVGWPKHAWWQAALAQLIPLGLARFLTSPAHNVNLAHAVHPAWADTFESYPLFFFLLFGLSFVIYLALHAAFSRLPQLDVRHRSEARASAADDEGRPPS